MEPKNWKNKETMEIYLSNIKILQSYNNQSNEVPARD